MVAQLFLEFQAGLFVYDIFWVFFTPVMVTVAKSFDAPIKVSVLSDWIFALDIFFHFIANNLIYSSVFSLLCAASVSHCGCCTPFLYAWPW
jgi:hypothetical protein